eukprot:g54645.t1
MQWYCDPVPHWDVMSTDGASLLLSEMQMYLGPCSEWVSPSGKTSLEALYAAPADDTIMTASVWGGMVTDGVDIAALYPGLVLDAGLEVPERGRSWSYYVVGQAFRASLFWMRRMRPGSVPFPLGTHPNLPLWGGRSGLRLVVRQAIWAWRSHSLGLWEEPRASGHHDAFCLWVPGISGCQGLVLVVDAMFPYCICVSWWVSAGSRGGLHSLRLSTSFEKDVAVPGGMPLKRVLGVGIATEGDDEDVDEDFVKHLRAELGKIQESKS